MILIHGSHPLVDFNFTAKVNFKKFIFKYLSFVVSNDFNCNYYFEGLNTFAIYHKNFDCHGKNGTWSTARNLFARKNWSTQFFNCSTPFEQMTKKWKLVDSQKSSAVHVFRAVSLLDKKISTTQIANGRQRFWKMSTARHNL